MLCSEDFGLHRLILLSCWALLQWTRWYWMLGTNLLQDTERISADELKLEFFGLKCIASDFTRTSWCLWMFILGPISAGVRYLVLGTWKNSSRWDFNQKLLMARVLKDWWRWGLKSIDSDSQVWVGPQETPSLTSSSVLMIQVAHRPIMWSLQPSRKISIVNVISQFPYLCLSKALWRPRL